MHDVIENFAPPALLRAVGATWPHDDWAHWHKYNDENSVKLASKDAHRVPDAARLVLASMANVDVSRLAPESFPDLDLHGAGLHSIFAGGHLALHLDGAVHPLTGWRRECNAVLFVDDWQPAWGGELEFWTDPASGPFERIIPAFNKLVLFSTSDSAWHRVAKVAGDKPRRTLSLFWWSQGTASSTRDRAAFIRPLA
ncbi:MAG TPA: 2OG-Fe(II) oxygenase [Planctomycetaceae bacterium]|jgi:Rps23 Pro-64 3,4-dihydroxylase Tpa1-like proline 4-hydroxylase